MTDSAPPAELRAETLAALRADDLITPVEQLRHSTFQLLDWLPEGVDDGQAENGFQLLRGRLEECLAIAQPLLDFGRQRGVEEVCWMLQALASEQGDPRNLSREPMSSLALHDLAWTLLADCLARDRIEPLVQLSNVAIPESHDSVATPIYQATDVRHADAYRREAGRTYASWRDWIRVSGLVAAMPHLRAGPRLSATLAEAELIAALCFASEHGERSFCASLGDGGAERRLRSHYRKHGAGAFGRLFGVDDMESAKRMNELYAQLVGPDGFHPPTTLIAT